MVQSEMVAKARDQVNSLRHANEDLSKQVEGLQMNRFSEVEELVYLRWLNACLRYELRNYQTPTGKTSARDLSKSLSPRSQERAKRLMLEYAGSERGQGDTDLDSVSSQPSSPGSEDFDNASIDSSSSRYSNVSRKISTSLIHKLKRWGKSKDDSIVSSPSRSFGGNSPRASISRKMSMSKGPLESLMLRNAGDGVAITTFGKQEQDPTDSLNDVASSFQLMSKSVEGVLNDRYPAYKDRHKLALEREKAIKEKADQARAQKFGDGSNLNSKLNSDYISRAKAEREQSVTLPPKLAKIKEKVVGDSVGSESIEQANESKDDTPIVSKIKLAHIEKRAPRVPRPPPKSSGSAPPNVNATTTSPSSGIPPPPPQPPGAPPPPPRPPPPPGSLSKGLGTDDKFHRAPELVEFYQSLMKREAKKDTTSVNSTTSNVADVRSNMIGEIENRSAFLLAVRRIFFIFFNLLTFFKMNVINLSFALIQVKADVETQGDFVQSLATEVRAASFTNIEDLVSFVNWLDEELSFLVCFSNFNLLEMRV